MRKFYNLSRKKAVLIAAAMVTPGNEPRTTYWFTYCRARSHSSKVFVVWIFRYFLYKLYVCSLKFMWKAIDNNGPGRRPHWRCPAPEKAPEKSAKCTQLTKHLPAGLHLNKFRGRGGYVSAMRLWWRPVTLLDVSWIMMMGVKWGRKWRGVTSDVVRIWCLGCLIFGLRSAPGLIKTEILPLILRQKREKEKVNRCTCLCSARENLTELYLIADGCPLRLSLRYVAEIRTVGNWKETWYAKTTLPVHTVRSTGRRRRWLRVWVPHSDRPPSTAAATLIRHWGHPSLSLNCIISDPATTTRPHQHNVTYIIRTVRSTIILDQR